VAGLLLSERVDEMEVVDDAALDLLVSGSFGEESILCSSSDIGGDDARIDVLKVLYGDVAIDARAKIVKPLICVIMRS
jgi:hypothetical protein